MEAAVLSLSAKEGFGTIRTRSLVLCGRMGEGASSANKAALAMDVSFR